jgi:alkylated DNA repair protein (DNA oxidative demethylase)
MTPSLFDEDDLRQNERRVLAPGATLLRGFALPFERDLVDSIESITRDSPFRHMTTPGGFAMSVATSSCGTYGWVSDSAGYRYASEDPERGRPWPPMPEPFQRLALDAAAAGGYADFRPDACLINRYAPGARLSLHQDRDERSFAYPIVSVSLGIPAIFVFGGMKRTDPARRIPLRHGDVVVWGGPSRLYFHGVLPLQEEMHPLLGRYRINLTFRRAA